MLTETEQPSSAWRETIAWGPKEVLQAVGVVIATLVFVTGAIALAVAIAGLSLSDAQVLGISLVATIVLDCLLFGLSAALSVGKYRLRWSTLGFRPLAMGQIWVPAATVAGVFAILGAYGVIVQLFGLDKLIPEESLDEDIFDNRALVAMAGVLAVLAAPIAEETFFRGFMFGGLAKRWGFFWAALASGLLFSLAHAQLTTLIPFTLVGMLFAGVYVYAGSLWASIGAHFLYNLISFAIMLGGWLE
jgi:membrane protease YdiL (CAAX protease family)